MIYHAACQAGMIAHKEQAKFLSWPERSLAFSGAARTWQEVVLAIFDPGLTTHAMQATILSDAMHEGEAFDHMRKAFIDRYEFACTRLESVSLAE